MDQLNKFKRIHFIGIGGAGMSAIAWILLKRGFEVSGSDSSKSETTRRLILNGATVFEGHRSDNIKDVDLVVTSTAIRADNPERIAAEVGGIPIWRRARVLAEIMRAGKAIAVSGTHGKTTTTSMLGLMLSVAQMDPTVLIGGELNDFGGNARPGLGEWVVAEADESDASFLDMEPDRIITTNIDADHLDFYADHNEIVRTFAIFFDRLRAGGKVIACLDDPAVAGLLALNKWPAITYGVASAEARMRAENIHISPSGRGFRFTPVWDGRMLDEVELCIPGRHNVLNALAALACGLDIGAPYEPMRRALGFFEGAKRRFQIKGIQDGVTIVDDYAHHPTEIAATLSAARSQLTARQTGRLVGVFQPHRYSRTMKLAGDFGKALTALDLAVVTDVYPAGEKPIAGVSGQLVYDHLIAEGHTNAHYCPTLADTRSFLARELESGDLFLTLGAGNIYTVGEGLLEDLRLRGETLGEKQEALANPA